MTCLEPHLPTGQVKVKKVPTRKENLLFSDDPTGIFRALQPMVGFSLIVSKAMMNSH